MNRKSKEKQQVVKALYEGNQQTMMRESLGIVTESAGGVFMRRCHPHHTRPLSPTSVSLPGP